MLSITVFDLDGDSFPFICDGFSSSSSGTLELNFRNGAIIISHDCYSHFFVYPHNRVVTNVFNPFLLLEKSKEAFNDTQKSS